MLVANIADLHARGRDLIYWQNQMMAAMDACNSRRVDLITWGGDIFDTPNVGDQHAETGRILNSILSVIDAADAKILAITGQHDQHRSNQTAAICALENEQLRVCQHPAIAQIPDLNILCLPWLHEGNAEAEIQRLHERLPISSKKMLLAHVQVRGASYGHGQTHDKDGPATVSRGFLESCNFDRIALGDFHQRQDLFGGKGGYVGALRQMTFGEAGNPQGVEIWDTESGDVEWIEMNEAPRHEIIELAEAQDLPKFANDPDPAPYRWIKCLGWTPNEAQVREFESARHGNRVTREEIERIERVVRSAEIPPDLITTPGAVIRMWSGAQDSPLSTEEIEALVAEEALA